MNDAEWLSGLIGRRVYHRRADLFGTVIGGQASNIIRGELAKVSVRYEWPHDGKELKEVLLAELYDAHAAEVDAAVGRLERTLQDEYLEQCAAKFPEPPPTDDQQLKLAGGKRPAAEALRELVPGPAGRLKPIEAGELEEQLVSQVRSWFRRGALALKLDQGYRAELKLSLHTPETADDDALWLHAELEEVVRTEFEGDVPGVKGPSAGG